MLAEKGIDPAFIEQIINNSPAMIQAQQILEERNRAEVQRRLDDDLKIVSQMAPDIKSIKDIENHSSYPVVLQYVEKGLSLPEAFKLANYDSLSNKSTEAAKQAAINQAKSKGHLETTNSVSGSSDLVDIPDSEISTWRDYYPGLSDAELKKKYNRTISN